MNCLASLRNSRQNTGAYDRGVKNLELILIWVFNWGWTTERVLQTLLGIARRPTSDLVRRGILVPVDGPRGFAPAFVLAHAHTRRARELNEMLQRNCERDMNYPYPRRPIPFKSLGEHNEEAQLICLDELKPGDRLTTWRAWECSPGSAVPDFAIERNKQVIWHEVELNGKSGDKLIYQLYLRHRALKQGKFNRICWWFVNRHDSMNVTRLLQSHGLPKIRRESDGRLIRTEYDFWNPRELLNATTAKIRLPGESNYSPIDRLQGNFCDVIVID